MASSRKGRNLRWFQVLVILAILVGFGVIATTTALAISLCLKDGQNCLLSDPITTDGNTTTSTDTTTTSTPTDRVQWPPVPDSSGNEYRYASVACADKRCSQIGVQIMAEGGSAVDAMVAVALCLGVSRPLSSGIGGGSFMTFYQRETKKTVVLDYRETAPLAANASMLGNSSNDVIGGPSIGVPGEVAGLWEAHQQYGKLPWAKLFEPSIKMAEEGVIINEYVFEFLKRHYDGFDDELKLLYTNSDTGRMKQVGDKVKFSKLAATYRRIADNGSETYYRGALKDDILADLQEFDGSIITEEDLANYTVEKKAAIEGTLRNGGYTMMSAPPPSGGIVVQYILRILDGYNFTKESVSDKKEEIENTTTTYHRIMEAMKFAYALRSNLGDPKFIANNETITNMTSAEFANHIRSRITDNQTQPIDYYGANIVDHRLTTGTCQVSILAGNGDAISLTSSINSGWGSKRMGNRTGIIFNNQMDDFSRPEVPSWTDDAWTAPTNENNWIEPGKRPLSAMSPTIFIDGDGDVVLVTGGAGGSRIIGATVLTVINNLWLGMNLTEAVSRPRIHHQLLPAEILHETGFPKVYLDGLRKKGHAVKHDPYLPASDSVSHQHDLVFGVGDPRRKGASDGF